MHQAVWGTFPSTSGFYLADQGQEARIDVVFSRFSSFTRSAKLIFQQLQGEFGVFEKRLRKVAPRN